MSDLQTVHPKPLAFTKSAGGSVLIKAVYRSGELWHYCQAMPNSEALYNQYLSDPQIVVLDDDTLLLHRLEAPVTLLPTTPPVEDTLDYNTLGAMLQAYNIDINDDDE